MKYSSTPKRSNTLTLPLILILSGLILFLTRSGMVDRQLVLQLLPLLPMVIGGSLLFFRLRRRAG